MFKHELCSLQAKAFAAGCSGDQEWAQGFLSNQGFRKTRLRMLLLTTFHVHQTFQSHPRPSTIVSAALALYTERQQQVAVVIVVFASMLQGVKEVL